LQGLNEGEPGEEAPPAEGEGEAQPGGEEEAEESTEDAAKPASGDPFGEEALKTPEGIQTARQILNKRNAKVTRREMATERRAKTLAEREAQFSKREERLLVIEKNREEDFNMLRRGDARAKIVALGRLGGQDGYELLEELNIELATGKKPAPPAQEVPKEILERLDRAERALAQRTQAEEREAGQRRIREAQDGLISQAKSASQQYPHLAQLAASDPEMLREAIHHAKTTYHEQHKSVLDDGELFATLEEYLAHLRGGPPAAVKTNAGAGQATGAAPVAAKPGSGRTARPPIAKTISPGLATQSSGAQRFATEEEVIEAAAKDDEWLNGLFPRRKR
jgi:hypothetical protein